MSRNRMGQLSTQRSANTQAVAIRPVAFCLWTSARLILPLAVLLNVPLGVSCCLADEPWRRTFLIDIPGVNWTGRARESDWGRMLWRNRITVHIRHQGPGRDKWSEPSGPNSVVDTLPRKWNQKAAQQLNPFVARALLEKRDVHSVVDKNITLPKHLVPVRQSGEDNGARTTSGTESGTSGCREEPATRLLQDGASKGGLHSRGGNLDQSGAPTVDLAGLQIVFIAEVRHGHLLDQIPLED